MTHFARKHKEFRDVDLIPMINIIFMLLFFFIIAGTVRNIEPIPVDIPQAKSGTKVRGNPVVLSLSRGGRIIYEGNAVSETLLPSLIQKTLSKDDNTLIIMRVDERLPAHSLTKLLTLVHKSGGINLALEIETG